MARPGAIVNALKSVPGGARITPAPQASGMGRISPVYAQALYNNPYENQYGPFLDRPSSVFTDGAFSPASPIQPTPIDVPPPGGTYPGPRWWPYRQSWNLPTPPGSEGLKLASFDQLRTLAQKYSVARSCIELRQEEIRGLDWSVGLTTDAAKAYRDDRASLRDFGERKAKFERFFRRPDPDFWNFDSFLAAMLEEIFVYDALTVIFRPKFGASFGMGGRGLLGSDLDSIRLVSGPTIRPLLDLQGGTPAAPAPAYQQFLFGVPRSDYMSVIRGTDIDEAGLLGAEVNEFNADIMLYAPYWRTRETPYGFPPVERALLPIISGLQKQEFQLDYFTEGTVPAVYISPGDPNITPTQIGELQSALNSLAGDPAYHLKVVVLPPGSKVEPQRPVDLSDSFDYLVMNQVCMAFDIQPQELGIIPNVGATPTGPSASGIRFAGMEGRDIKNRKSTKPLLKFICDIFNTVIQDICGQWDMQFQFEGLVDDEDKQAITTLGVEQVQNGISSIDEIRERLDLPPWGLQETSEPVVFTAQGPIPFSMAPQLIAAMTAGAAGNSSSSDSKKKTGSGQGTNGGQNSSHRTKQPSVRRGGQTKPNGSHPAPLAPHREPVSGAHAAAAGAIQSPTPRTGGTTSRSSVAGSRKKAVSSEFAALKRHLRKGRLISTWDPVNITNGALGMIAEDIAKGVLLDVAVERAESVELLKLDVNDMPPVLSDVVPVDEPWFKSAGDDIMPVSEMLAKQRQWPGWRHDIGLVGAYEEIISQAFQDAEIKGREIRKDVATGKMYATAGTMLGLISDSTRDILSAAMNPLWTKAWNLGYASARALVAGSEPDFKSEYGGDALDGFLGSEGRHWVEEVSRTGLGNSNARSKMIARTEVSRAMVAAAIQAYRDHGVAYKELLVSPDDACEECLTAKAQGEIPLDAVFGVVGEGADPPFHPNCRCMPAPAGTDRIPPEFHLKYDRALDVTGDVTITRGRLKGVLADLASASAYQVVEQQHPYHRDPQSGAGNCMCGRTEAEHPEPVEDEHRLGWLLIRARDDDGKYRFLLQQHHDGAWGMPGGKLHVGEDPYQGAVRETTEEVGDLPPLHCVKTFHHVEDDGDTQVFLYLCETSYFIPAHNGDTPEETRGAAWFRRKEIAFQNLTPKFREDWETGIRLYDHVTKSRQHIVTAEGEWLDVDDPERRGAGTGSRWPYPRRSPDGGEPREWPDAGPGAQDGEMGAAEPPRQGPQELSSKPVTRVYPRGSDDEGFPRRRGKLPPAGKFPHGPDGKWPQGGHGDSPVPRATSVGKNVPGRGFGSLPRVHPGMEQSLSGGPVPAVTPHPYEPHAEPPVTMAPDANEHDWGELNDSPEHRIMPVHEFPVPDYNHPRGKGAQHVTDPNPVEWRHVFAQMESNFPPGSIEWVKRARWIGPVNIPWSRIDDDDIDKWAASHQPGKVNEFVTSMRSGNRSVAPSILVQEPGSGKAFIVDGHHRALAHKKLGQPVLAYVGNIAPRDRKAAMETHSSQIHQGSDPANKSAAAKSSHEVAHYRVASSGERCGNCWMYQGNSRCTAVESPISPVNVCDYWEPLK